MERFDYIVIGGGIVGLSIALATLEKNPKIRIAVLEKERRLGSTSNRSEQRRDPFRHLLQARQPEGEALP